MSALRDLKALSDASLKFSELGKTEASAILLDVQKLEADPQIFSALQIRAFIEKGLDLVQGPDCPLCDLVWEDEKQLRSHLKKKLAKSEEAQKLQESLLKNAADIGNDNLA